MVVRYVLLAVGLVAVVGLASVFSLVTGKPAGDPNSFRLSVGTDRSVYRAGESVRLSGKVCSKSWWWFQEGGGRGLRVSWRVLDEEGQTVADTSHVVHTLELHRRVWWPRMCRSWEDTWDLHYWNRPDQPRSYAGPARGDQVLPGKYRIEATWRVSRWADRPMSSPRSGSATHTQLSDEFDIESGE